MFKNITLIFATVLVSATFTTGCIRGGYYAEVQAQIDKVAAPGTPLARGDFFEFMGECFALNLVEKPFDNGPVLVSLYPEESSVNIFANDLARYGARLVPEERKEEALHKWVMQKYDKRSCFFKETK